jgi:hypothetical protein
MLLAPSASEATRRVTTLGLSKLVQLIASAVARLRAAISGG